MDRKFIGDIDQMARSYDVQSRKSKDDIWELLNKQLDSVSHNENTHYLKLNWFVGSAAAAAVFLTIMYLGMFNTGKYTSLICSEYLQTQSVYLPDSSLITLNSNSNIKYHYNKFTGERSVVLAGEAFFEVKKGKKFSVEFPGGKVKVLGTKFNVLAYSDKCISVDCTEGTVRFFINKKNFLINEGQGIRFFNGKILGPYAIQSELVKERLNGAYYWDKISNEELFQLIGNHFGYKIKLDREIAIRNFSGKVDFVNLQNSLTIVAYAMDLRYVVDQETQTITVHAK